MRKISPILTEIIEVVVAIQKDAGKFDRGNTAAGIRVRKAMQSVRNYARTVRTEIQKTRKERKKDAEKSKAN